MGRTAFLGDVMSEPVRDPNEGIGLAARVILHLARLERLRPNDVARLDYTQQGMVAVFAVRQSSLGRVLQLLEAGDLVTVERRYVADAQRRMKVYRLTVLGQSTSRNLQRNASAPARLATVNGWIAEPARGVGKSYLSKWTEGSSHREETDSDSNG